MRCACHTYSAVHDEGPTVLAQRNIVQKTREARNFDIHTNHTDRLVRLHHWTGRRHAGTLGGEKHIRVRPDGRVGLNRGPIPGTRTRIISVRRQNLALDDVQIGISSQTFDLMPARGETDEFAAETSTIAFHEHKATVRLTQVNPCQLRIAVQLRQKLPLETHAVRCPQYATLEQFTA